MVRSLCRIGLVILLAGSVGIHASEAPAANPTDMEVASETGEANSAPKSAEQPQLAAQIKALQVPFIASDTSGSAAEARYVAKTLAGSVLASDQGVTYQLKQGVGTKPSTVAIKETWIKPEAAKVSGLKPSKARFNFYKGADQRQWKRNVPAYEEVGFGQVYQGVFVTLKAYNNNVEKIFTVSSGADPHRIAVRVDGISDLRINHTGELELRSGPGILRMTAPVAYQEVNGERRYVKARYHKLTKNSYGFKVASYDRSLPLIIDPLLASTFLGEADSDIGYAIDSDNASIYVTGWTNSAYFPITDGAYDPIHKGGSYDVFVSRYTLDLNLEASTFLGGSADDFGVNIAVADLDSDGTLDAIYVAGSTKSNDFPIPVSDNGTTTAFDTRFNGVQDGFLCRLNPALTDLEVATYLGGTGTEQIYAMKIAQIQSFGPPPVPMIYVTGPTQSKNFPVLGDSAFSVVLSGSNDVFLAALDQDLRLHFSTFLGGTASDIPYALDVKADKVFVAGSTLSANFPTSPGAYRRTLVGSKGDAFICRLNYSLGHLEGSTFLGGSTDDAAYALAVDGNDTVIRGVYVAGYSNSVNFPTMTAYTSGKKTNGKEDMFLAWLAPTLTGKYQDSSKYAATLLGGSMSDYVMAMKLDETNERLVVVGYTKSNNFPTKPRPSPAVRPYTAYNGKEDGIVMFVDDNLTVSSPIIEWIYLGGTADDRPSGLAVVSTGNLYVVGTTKSSNFPVTDGSYQGKEDAFISAFEGSGLRPLPSP